MSEAWQFHNKSGSSFLPGVSWPTDYLVLSCTAAAHTPGPGLAADGREVEL